MKQTVTLTNCYYKRTNYKNGSFVIMYIDYKGKEQHLFPRGYERTTAFSVKGDYLPEVEGMPITLTGTWEVSAQYGVSLKVDSFSVKTPRTESGIRNYLETLKGVGPVMSQKLFDELGADVIQILSDPDTKGLKSISDAKLEDIRNQLRDKHDEELSQLMAEFPQLSAKKLSDIRDKFKDKTASVLRHTPYDIVKVDGIGFDTADKIAIAVNPNLRHSDERLLAATNYVISEASSRGHLFLEQRELMTALKQRLPEVENMRIVESLRKQLEKKEVEIERYEGGVAVYSKDTLQQEKTLAENIVKLVSASISVPDNVDRLIDNYQIQHKINFHVKQREAIKNSLTSPFSIITGGPGTGKTTVINCIKSIFQEIHGKYARISLLAPTGRAAKRMSETSGMNASTIHSALGIRPNSSFVEEGVLSEEKLIIVDEVSMVDSNVANLLFKSVAPGTQVVVIGDKDQLEAVGPGNVLAEMLKSNVVPYVMLERGYRASKDSSIIENAEAINRGLNNNIIYDDSFTFIQTSGAKDSQETAVRAFAENVTLYGIDEVMYLSPYRKEGMETNVNSINPVLRETVHPMNPNTAFKVKAKTYDIGNKVMCMRNTHFAQNGEIGYIVDKEDTEIYVQFSEGVKVLSYDDFDDIDLAYATTIHKSQGSEWECVILNLENAHHIMLQRRLVYTAITRAKSKVIIIGNKNAFHRAVRDFNREERNTFLSKYIQEEAKNW